MLKNLVLCFVRELTTSFFFYNITHLALIGWPSPQVHSIKSRCQYRMYAIDILTSRIDSMNQTQFEIHDIGSPALDFMSKLTASNTGDILAATITFTTADLHVGPGPVRASTRSTHYSVVVATGADGTCSGDILECQTGDGDTTSRVAMEITTVIVLLDEHTVSVISLASFGHSTNRIG